MSNYHLRKVGGSVMLVVPPAVLEMLSLSAGSTVGVVVDSGRLIVEPRKPRVTLADLIAQCDPNAPLPQDREWVDAPPVGRELI